MFLSLIVPMVVSEAESKVCRLLPAEETFCYANAETAIIMLLRAPRQSQNQIVIQLSRAKFTNDASRTSKDRRSLAMTDQKTDSTPNDGSVDSLSLIHI